MVVMELKDKAVYQGLFEIHLTSKKNSLMLIKLVFKIVDCAMLSQNY